MPISFLIILIYPDHSKQVYYLKIRFSVLQVYYRTAKVYYKTPKMYYKSVKVYLFFCCKNRNYLIINGLLLFSVLVYYKSPYTTIHYTLYTYFTLS